MFHRKEGLLSRNFAHLFNQIWVDPLQRWWRHKTLVGTCEKRRTRLCRIILAPTHPSLMLQHGNKSVRQKGKPIKWCKLSVQVPLMTINQLWIGFLPIKWLDFARVHINTFSFSPLVHSFALHWLQSSPTLLIIEIYIKIFAFSFIFGQASVVCVCCCAVLAAVRVPTSRSMLFRSSMLLNGRPTPQQYKKYQHPLDWIIINKIYIFLRS